MNDDTINQLKDLMTPVAQKIGEGAQFGWEVVIKQQYVEAGIGLFFAIALCPLALVVGTWFLKKGRKMHEESNWTDWEVPTLLGWVLYVFATGAFVIGSITAITHFINPDYYAIQFFISLVQPHG